MERVIKVLPLSDNAFFNANCALSVKTVRTEREKANKRVRERKKMKQGGGQTECQTP